MKEEKRIYETQIVCENCRYKTGFEIPFGTTTENFIKGKVCGVCGCKIRSPL